MEKENGMTPERTATHEQWLATREKLLAREKEHTRLGDELARERRELPWVRIEKEYTLETAEGPKTLAELFAGRSQLVIYNFMFGPDYDAGCPVCSSIADSFNGVLAQLRARDVTMICISKAPVEKLLAYRERMGWEFEWASSFESDFNEDFERSRPRDEANARNLPPVVAQFAASAGTDAAGYVAQRPGLLVFALSDGEVYLTYSTTARGLEPVMTYYEILDRVPRGRNEGEPALPTWMRRHDEFAAA
jgi:predicted dithiol-disulfide oxidoreductase (DUF899 family)